MMPDNMKEVREALSNHEPSDGSVDVEPIVKALEAEQIDSLSVLNLCFPKEEDVAGFALNKSLNIDQYDWLMKVTRFSKAIANTLIEEAVSRRLYAKGKRAADDPYHFVTSSDIAGAIRCSESSKMRRLESAASKCLLGNTGPSQATISWNSLKEVSLQALNEKRRETVIFSCNRLFSRLGSASVRYTKVFGPDNMVKCVSMMNMMIEAYFATAGVECVGHYCKIVNEFLFWLSPICSLGCVTELEVGAFLRDGRIRGEHVASRMRCALCWAEKVFKLQLHTDDVMVRAMCKRRSDMEAREAPAKAKCPTVELVKLLEEACCNVKNPVVIRVMAGFMCACVHGVLRWSDFQRSVRLELGKDMLMAKATMKKKNVLTPWVAPRRGFSGHDWGKAFFFLLQQHKMPGPDFVLLEPRGLFEFRNRTASYASVVVNMRIALIHLGVSPKESLKYTLHGWRQLYPTMANQLALPELEQESIGHWKKGSSMPQHYDTITNSLETRAKGKILEALTKGFIVGKKGEFLMTVPNPKEKFLQHSQTLGEESDDSVGATVLVQGVSPVKASKHHVKKVRCGPDAKKIVTQVRNCFSRAIHLHTYGQTTAFCGWVCGTKSSPALKAEFMASVNSLPPEENVKDLCGGCYSDAGVTSVCHVCTLPTKENLTLEESDQSSCESEVASNASSTESTPEEVDQFEFFD